MEKVSNFILRKSDSFPTIMREKEIFLPMSTKPQSKLRVRALLGHCLYRRVVVWGLVAVALLSITLFNPQLTHRSKNVLDLVQIVKADVPAIKVPSNLEETVAALVKQSGQGNDEEPAKQSKNDNEEQIPVKESSDSSKDKSGEKSALETTEDKPRKDKSGEKSSKKKHKQKPKPNGPHWLDYKQ